MCDNKIDIFEIIINEKYDRVNDEHHDIQKDLKKSNLNKNLVSKK